MKIIHGIILAITLSVISSCNTDKTTVALKLTGNNEPNRFDTLLNQNIKNNGTDENQIRFVYFNGDKVIDDSRIETIKNIEPASHGSNVTI